MTILINKTARDSLNIDTVERGIVLALLLLRNACTSQSKTYSYYNAIKISTSVRGSGETYIANLIATAKIPYRSQSALLAGMNLIENLKELTSVNPSPTFTTITQSVNPPALPIEPSTVNTLEKYLLFYCQILGASLLPSTDRVRISFLEDDPTEPSLYIELTLPINWQVYLLTGNLIEAVKLLVTRYITDSNTEPEPDLSNSDFSNQSVLGNLSLVGN